MLDKFVRIFYSIISIVIHISLITLIFSVPVLFAVKAKAPLDFKVNSVNISPVQADDETFMQVSSSVDGWYKVTYDATVKASALSPYGYKIEGFAVNEPSELRFSDCCKVFLDEPIEFKTGQSDDFILICYVKYDGVNAVTEDYAKSFSFGTRNITRIFSFFKYKIPIFVPEFDVAKCIA